MFKALFLVTLFITLVVNILFLFATKEKPPDLSTSTYMTISQDETSSQRRLFLRSNELYDYPSSVAIPKQKSSRNESQIQQAKTNDMNNVVRRRPNEISVQLNADKPAIAKEQLHSDIKPLTTVFPRELDENRSIVVASIIGDKKAKENRYEVLESNMFNLQEEGKEGEKKNSQPLNLKTNPQLDSANHFISTEILVSSSLKNNPRSSSYDSLHRIPNQDDSSNPDNRQFNQQVSSSSEVNKQAALDIKVKSSKDHVFISVNNIVIYESRSIRINHNDNQEFRKLTDKRFSSLPTTSATQISDEIDAAEGRGIHVVVLNEYNGSVMSKRIFDTYSPQQDEELCHYINMIHDGRILIFAVKDEASFKMPQSSPARILLQRMGSEHIMKLKWRDMWAFIVHKTTAFETDIRLGESQAKHGRVKGAEYNMGESLAKSSRFSDWAPPVILEARIDLLESDTSNEAGIKCNWKSDEKAENLRRFDFCSRIEGYGRVCDCDLPAPISFKPQKIENSQLYSIPIVVMASNRPHYLFRMLRSLLMADGVIPSMITVFIDGFYDEPLMVSQLFNLRAIQQKPLGQRSARISHHYKSSLTATFELFPEAEFAIIFEEDLDIAQDALIYFNQTVENLREDSSLYCVSAWNDQGYEHSAHDNRLVYRIETMPGLGWMLSRKLYKEELEQIWPSADQPHDWDMWIRTEGIRKERECIIPDISRTFHFGSIGTNINSYFQKQYFSMHAFNLVPNRRRFTHLDELEENSYEKLIEKLVREGRVIDKLERRNTTANIEYLCSLANITDAHSFASDLRNIKNSREWEKTDRINDEQDAVNNVIYIDMIDKRDFGSWLKLASCWHLWDLDARGQHKSMWRLFLNGQPTMVIGVPASPYSQFKPPNLVPFKLS